LAKITSELKEKEKENEKLKSATPKEAINPKIFKALAEENQSEKAKALNLTNKIKLLTEDLKEKEKEISLLKSQNQEKTSPVLEPKEGEKKGRRN